MEIFLSILSVVYLILLIFLLISWKRIRFIKSPEFISSTFISVIVAVRNEEKNIGQLLEDLNAQDYPGSLFEVLIIDDHSTDSTPEIVKSYIPKVKFNLVVVSPENSVSSSYKKKAIQAGISLSKGILIVTTDGDCRVGNEWLSTIENFYKQRKAKFISSPVSFFRGDNLFMEMQRIEFASLIGSGAASLNMSIPNMCNGANIAYEKSAFIEVDGFQGNENIPSGDDEFLMHKIFRKYPDKVFFLKSEAALVFTEAKKTLSEFFNQRKRWASKWGSYTYFNIKVLAFFIFLYNLSLLIAGGMVIAGKYSPALLALQFSLKVILESLFLADVLRLSRGKIRPFLFLLMQVMYPFYVVIVAVLSRSGRYDWKGRKFGH